MKTKAETMEVYYHRRAGELLSNVSADIDSGVVRKEDVVKFLKGPDVVPFCKSLRKLSVEECNARIQKLSLAERDGLRVIFSKAFVRKFRR